ncbi:MULTISPECIES: DUF4402 domain-containing protein [Fusobacterium]|uniref:DUF4402 domain-containing protein n=1 Tax=Fusobacterium TaxID=848 RepID=UPI00147711E6|nr:MULTISPECIES: DUF4402 domain-containing protein [Fusobacterium]NME36199.1 DUF4402 domain-containing protein [Fusobacterium sp. FSA-380-WT-3A]
MKKIFYIFVFLTFSFSSYCKNYLGEFLKFYPEENLVVETTSRIRFSSEISIIKENGNINDFFYLSLENKRNFINLNNIKISSLTGVKEGKNIYFKNSVTNEGLQEIKILLEGEIIFNWLIKNQNISNIKIGYINSNVNPVYLTLDINMFNPIHSLKIKVVNNMNLGKVEAGNKLSTKSFGTPANLTIEGQENKKVSITIPKNITIKNSKNDTLSVDLKFRDNNKQKLIRELSHNGKNTYKTGNNKNIVSKDILIDGESQTNKNSRGIYKGVFTVRVEYID